MASIGEIYHSKRSDKPYMLQLVARDMTALNSDVVAIWKSADVDVNLVKPDLFLHTTVLAGERLGYWEKTGKVRPIDYSAVRFKLNAEDELVVVPDDTKSKLWHVWQVGYEWRTIKKKLYEDEAIFPGSVYPPLAIE